MWTLILTGMLLTTTPEVEVQTLAGRTVAGALVQVDEKQITVRTADGRRSLPVAELMSLAPTAPPRASGEDRDAWVELVDDSWIVGREYTVQGDRARLVRPGGDLEIPTRDIRSVRFQAEDDAVATEWRRILDDDVDGDLLVARKADSLNYHRGVLGDVTDARVKFSLGGDVLPVKRSKVFGLIYYHPAGRELPATVCTLTDATGSRWSVHSLRLTGTDLQATTSSGLSVTLPLETIVRVDFSRGKIVYLADLDPDSVQWTPYFGTAEELPARATLHAPRRDRSVDGRPLQLGGKTYDKGLAVHSRTVLEYRLPDAFRRFIAVVGIDDHVRPSGSVQLAIHGDDRILFETTLAGTDPPQPIDLNLDGVRRLTILVDFGENLDLADHLDLCEARLVK